MYDNYDDQYENEELEQLETALDNPETIDDEIRQEWASQNLITTTIETSPESLELIKKLINASIVSATDFSTLFNKAVETQNQTFVELTYAAASHLKTYIDFEPVINCFEYEFANDNSLMSFQIATLMILSTNQYTQNHINDIFLRTLSTNPFVAEFIGEYFEIDRTKLNENGQNALQIAADYGQHEMFQFLLERPDLQPKLGQRLKDEQYEQYYKYLTHRDNTKIHRPLLFSIAQSPAYKEILPKFIEKAINLATIVPHSKHNRQQEYLNIFKAQDEKGNTWMTYLVNRNATDILERFKFFNSCGINLSTKDKNNKNILEYISLYYSDMPQASEIVDFLVKDCNMDSQEARFKFPNAFKQQNRRHSFVQQKPQTI